MFIVYNDSPVWKIEKKDRNGFCVRNSLHTGKVSLFVNDKEFEDTLKPECNLKTCNNIYDKGLVVSFNDKNLVPSAFVTEKAYCAELAAISVTVPNDYRITSFYNNNATIYSHDIVPNEYVDFIANFTKRGKRQEITPPRISITMVNDKEQKVISVVAAWNRSKKIVSVFTKQLNIADIPEKGKRGFINLTDFVARNVESGKEIIPVFYPSSPTHLIVVSSKEKGVLLKTIKEHKHWRSANQYKIVTIDNPEKLQSMVNEGYIAVTLMYGIDMTLEAGKSTNNPLFEKAKELFDTVYLLGKNGFVYKAKVAGREM